MAMLGFYGGTFDPIHQGHLQLALYVQQFCQLDQLQILPCHLPPHRAHPGVSSAHRSAMVQLAIAPYPQLQLNRLELDKNAPSYTVETLQQLKQQHPQDTLLFVIGMDSLCQFTRWHRWQDILQLCHLLVCQRPGYQPDDPLTQQLLLQHQASQLSQLQQQPSGLILLLDNPLLDISASEIRAALFSAQPSSQPAVPASDQAQQSVDPALQICAVSGYIRQHQLYSV